VINIIIISLAMASNMSIWDVEAMGEAAAARADRPVLVPRVFIVNQLPSIEWCLVHPPRATSNESVSPPRPAITSRSCSVSSVSDVDDNIPVLSTTESETASTKSLHRFTFQPFDAHCSAVWAQHPVPDRVNKPSFVNFDIRAL